MSLMLKLRHSYEPVTINEIKSGTYTGLYEVLIENICYRICETKSQAEKLQAEILADRAEHDKKPCLCHRKQTN